MCLLKAIAKYTCDDGFVPEGDTIRCCVQDDIFSIPMWSGSEPTCVGKLHLVFNRLYAIDAFSRHVRLLPLTAIDAFSRQKIGPRLDACN